MKEWKRVKPKSIITLLKYFIEQLTQLQVCFCLSLTLH